LDSSLLEPTFLDYQTFKVIFHSIGTRRNEIRLAAFYAGEIIQLSRLTY